MIGHLVVERKTVFMLLALTSIMALPVLYLVGQAVLDRARPGPPAVCADVNAAFALVQRESRARTIGRVLSQAPLTDPMSGIERDGPCELVVSSANTIIDLDGQTYLDPYTAFVVVDPGSSEWRIRELGFSNQAD